jgi:hypothetical protein
LICRFSLSRTIAVVLSTLAVVIASPPAPNACSHDPWNRVLAYPHETLEAAHAGSFAWGLRGILPAPAKSYRSVVPPGDISMGDFAAATETADLVAWLGARSEVDGVAVLDAHQLARGGLGLSGWRDRVAAVAPTELRLYLLGAGHLRRGKVFQAMMAWEELLELAPAERPMKTVWAHHMLATTARELGARPNAIVRYQATREAVDSGFQDSLGLALSALGWEAYAHYVEGDRVRAIRLYVSQAIHGDMSALASLRLLIRNALSDPDVRGALAADAVARPAVSALLASRLGMADHASGGPGVAHWIDAVTAQHDSEDPSSATPVVRHADRLALLAYRGGWYDVASKWQALASSELALTHWIGSKLSLRNGDVEAAAVSASAALGRHQASDAPAGASDGIYDDAAIFAMRRDDYVQAFNLLVGRAEAWLDAAYIAERVLTVDELRAMVDRRWPIAAESEWSVASRMRYLLGRRLARERRPAEAQRYLPEPWRSAYATFLEHLATARDIRGDAETRGNAFWSAAHLLRRQGIEMIGTEVAPDWQAYGGNYSDTAMPTLRSPPETLPPLNASLSELARVGRSQVSPNKRWHYRYLAGSLALEGANLLPKTSDKAARMLCHASSWIINRDPAASNVFYRAYQKRAMHLTSSIADFGRGCPTLP